MVRLTAALAVCSSSSTLPRPASAPAISRPTRVATAWNSGIETIWMPLYGTGLSVGWDGATALRGAEVTLANGAALMYAALAYVDSRVPGGVACAPYLSATILRYGLDVAQRTNSRAAS